MTIYTPNESSHRVDTKYVVLKKNLRWFKSILWRKAKKSTKKSTKSTKKSTKSTPSTSSTHKNLYSQKKKKVLFCTRKSTIWSPWIHAIFFFATFFLYFLCTVYKTYYSSIFFLNYRNPLLKYTCIFSKILEEYTCIFNQKWTFLRP